MYGSGEMTFVGFHNPSVRDFLKPKLGEQRLFSRLVSAASYFEQIELLVRYATHRDAPPAMEAALISAGDEVLDACVRLLDARLARKRFSFAPQSREHRVCKTIHIARAVSRGVDREWLLHQMEALCGSWEKGVGDRQAAVQLLRTLHSDPEADPAPSWIISAKCLLTEFEDVQDVASYNEFVGAFPSQVSEEDEDIAAEAFVAMVEAEVRRLSGDAVDADSVERALDELRSAAIDLSVDIESELTPLEWLLEDLPTEEPDDDLGTRRHSQERDWSESRSDAEIDVLFESLL